LEASGGMNSNLQYNDYNGSLWEIKYFDKIPSSNPKVEKGNRLQVATEIALIKGNLSYIDLTDSYHLGKIADYETVSMLIECKNWFTDHYRITVDKVKYQILPRFTYSGDKFKVLVITEGSKWDREAKRLVLRSNIHIVEVPPVRTNSDILIASNVIKDAISGLCRIDQDYTSLDGKTGYSIEDLMGKPLRMVFSRAIFCFLDRFRGCHFIKKLIFQLENRLVYLESR